MATLNLLPAQDLDTVMRYLESDVWYPGNSAGLNAGSVGAANEQAGVGMRFPNVTIPQGTTITTAYLIVRAKTSQSGTVVNSKISAEDIDNPATFIDDKDVFDTRFAAHTTARIDWNAIAAWTAGEDYNSPEIKTVIQEIVDRGGFASGNAIVIFWEDFDRNSTAGTIYRGGNSYKTSATLCPILHIEGVWALGRSWGVIIG